MSSVTQACSNPGTEPGGTLSEDPLLLLRAVQVETVRDCGKQQPLPASNTGPGPNRLRGFMCWILLFEREKQRGDFITVERPARSQTQVLALPHFSFLVSWAPCFPAQASEGVLCGLSLLPQLQQRGKVKRSWGDSNF